MKQALIKGFTAAVSSLVVAAAVQAQALVCDDAWYEALRAAEVREVGETEVRNLIGTLRDFKAADAEIAMDSPKVFDAIAASDEAMRVLRRNDFSAEGFRSAFFNVALAMGALSTKGRDAEVEANLERIKAEMPADHYAAVKARLLRSQELFARTPESNVRLVQEYEAELNAVAR